jgi:hypothetical protein
MTAPGGGSENAYGEQTPPGSSSPEFALPGFPQPASGYPPPGYPPPVSYPPLGYQNTPTDGSASFPPIPPAYSGPGGGYDQPYPDPSDYPDRAGGGGQQSGTNTLAIASLVASLIGVLGGIGAVVGIVLGAVALNQIKQTRQQGYGQAVTGIVVGVAAILINLVFLLSA